MYNNERCYIYNKAFYEAYFKSCTYTFRRFSRSLYLQDLERFDNIRELGKRKRYIRKGNSNTQYVKLQEEAGELAKALLKNDRYEIKDAIGDMVVVLTNLSTFRKAKYRRLY